MKYPRGVYLHVGARVAPLAGAWIEIDKLHKFLSCFLVAPLAGAWIEMLGCAR